jgi:hypothetical protein
MNNPVLHCGMRSDALIMNAELEQIWKESGVVSFNPFEEKYHLNNIKHSVPDILCTACPLR